MVAITSIVKVLSVINPGNLYSAELAIPTCKNTMMTIGRIDIPEEEQEYFSLGTVSDGKKDKVKLYQNTYNAHFVRIRKFKGEEAADVNPVISLQAVRQIKQQLLMQVLRNPTSTPAWEAATPFTTNMIIANVLNEQRISSSASAATDQSGNTAPQPRKRLRQESPA
ncbi:hypothetical protein DFS34DRAFT_691432 [Phlyctochytrium arcticum]|nr:hypothetical protein DFS34DRAFT_691432 [Phlyctochytrium arcticum]